MITPGQKLIILFLAALLFAGCSSSYRLKNYPDRDTFYKRLNDKAGDRSVKVYTAEGGAIEVSNGVEAVNDTIYLHDERMKREEKTIPLKLVSSIDYKKNKADLPAGFIMLEGGEKINAENIITLPDSVKFISLTNHVEKIPFLQSDLEKVSYNNRLAAAPLGALLGALVGAGVGALITHPYYSGYGLFAHSQKTYSNSTTVGAIVGALIGSMIAITIGHNYNFYF
jgi:hypothetical protein